MHFILDLVADTLPFLLRKVFRRPSKGHKEALIRMATSLGTCKGLLDQVSQELRSLSHKVSGQNQFDLTRANAIIQEVALKMAYHQEDLELLSA